MMQEFGSIVLSLLRFGGLGFRVQGLGFELNKIGLPVVVLGHSWGNVD